MQPVVHVRLRDFGRVLSTRDRGRETSEQLVRIADRPGDVILDFEGVEVATPPFLQELTNGIQSIIQTHPDTGRIVVVANMNDDLYETFGFVLARRKRALAYRRGERVELLEGKPHLAQTLDEAQRLRSFTAPQLAARLKIKDDTASQRLRKLLETGAVVRELDTDARQGVRHLYRTPSRELVSSGT
jgi:hypothetical protein